MLLRHLAFRELVDADTVNPLGDHDLGVFAVAKHRAGKFQRGLASSLHRQATTGWFPFVAFVFEEHNTACFDEDAFDRHGEIHSLPPHPGHSRRD